MALPYEIVFTVLDGAGHRSTGSFYINSAQTVANATTEAQGLLDSLADDCVGLIESATLRVPIDLSALTNNVAADAQSNVGYGHRWLQKSADGHRTVLNLPAADQSQSVDGSNALKSGALDPPQVVEDELISRPITTSHDEDVTVVTDSYETWGGKRIRNT